MLPSLHSRPDLGNPDMVKKSNRPTRNPQRPEPYVWLKAGAIGLGIGAAALAASGAANADDGPGATPASVASVASVASNSSDPADVQSSGGEVSSGPETAGNSEITAEDAAPEPFDADQDLTDEPDSLDSAPTESPAIADAFDEEVIDDAEQAPHHRCGPTTVDEREQCQKRHRTYPTRARTGPRAGPGSNP